MNKTIKQYISEAIKSSDHRETYRTAQTVHRDQRRRSGEPYFDHPKEVRNITRKFYPQDRVAQLAALLHDTLEDYEKGGVYSSEEEVIDAISSSIQNPSVRKNVINVVKSLTHDKGVDYTSYVLSLSGTSLRVKLTDMLHNLMTGPSEKQKRKYGIAIRALEKKYGGAPPDIHQHHMKKLLSLSDDSITESKPILFESPQGAGLIVVNEMGQFLALHLYGRFDIPKGKVDEGESHLEAAVREADEEASLSVYDFKWGTESFDTQKTRCWLVQTSQKPKIKKNPVTGEYEHHGWKWVDYDSMISKCHSHLVGAIQWAHKKVEGGEE
ncbi:NUDIX domain-containing protein [bacterium]|nr:NUDIX domain-containing protein [bacterium]